MIRKKQLVAIEGSIDVTKEGNWNGHIKYGIKFSRPPVVSMYISHINAPVNNINWFCYWLKHENVSTDGFDIHFINENCNDAKIKHKGFRWIAIGNID